MKKRTMLCAACALLALLLTACFGPSGTVTAETAFEGMKSVDTLLIKEGDSVCRVERTEAFSALFDAQAWRRCTPFEGGDPLLCVRLADKYEIWFYDGLKAEIRDGYVSNAENGVLQYVAPEGTREAVSEYARTYGEKDPADVEEGIFLVEQTAP